jgi:phage shock protein PspC (stress-responsive transcriptional regulator)
MDDMTQEHTEPQGDAAFDPQRLRDAPMAMRRSRSDRYFAGVCGGFAEYARIDPVVVRVLVAALAVTGAGLVLYLAAWVLVPEEATRAPRSTATTAAARRRRARSAGSLPACWRSAPSCPPAVVRPVVPVAARGAAHPRLRLAGP